MFEKPVKGITYSLGILLFAAWTLAAEAQNARVKNDGGENLEQIQQIQQVPQQVPQQVHVELILFQRNAIDETVIDRLLQLPTPAYESLMRSAFDLYSTTPADTIQQEAIRTTTATLLSKEYTLLQKNSDFDALAHISWTQPMYDFGEAITIQVTPHRYKSIIKAQARIFYNELYKLNLNVLYDSGHSSPTGDTPQSSVLFLQFERIMTTDKTYYLDHPLLGVLVRLTEVPV